MTKAGGVFRLGPQAWFGSEQKEHGSDTAMATVYVHKSIIKAEKNPA